MHRSGAATRRAGRCSGGGLLLRGSHDNCEVASVGVKQSRRLGDTFASCNGRCHFDFLSGRFAVSFDLKDSTDSTSVMWHQAAKIDQITTDCGARGLRDCLPLISSTRGLISQRGLGVVARQLELLCQTIARRGCQTIGTPPQSIERD
jgi:hypothetical protein